MGGIEQMKDKLWQNMRTYTNEDGELCMRLSNLEIEWLDAMEKLNEENLAAVFVAWEIESAHRMGKRMEMKEDG